METTKQTTRRQKPKEAADYGKTPPCAIEIEESVLGALMIDGTAMDKVVDILSAQCFYKDTHQLIYKAIAELYGERKPVDMHTVTERLRKNGDLEAAGGAYAVAMLTAKVASSAHIVFHAQIIAQKFLARELIGIASEIQT